MLVCKHILFFIILISGLSAQAEIYFTGQVGIHFPDTPQASLRLAHQFTGGYIFGERAGVGASTLVSTKRESAGVFRYSLIGPEATLPLKFWVEGLRGILRLGIADVMATSDGVHRTFNPFYWGLFLARDWPLVSAIDGGLEGGFYSVNGDTLKRDGITIRLKPFIAYHAMALVRVHF